MQEGQSQAGSRSRPKVITWFNVYCIFLCVIYLAVALFPVLIFFLASDDPEMPRAFAIMIGGLFALMGMVLFAMSLLPLVLRPRPWLWTYDLVIICLGMTSACFLPVCIPLMLFWIKPETKKYFGNEDNGK
jgi:hypothetical protein